MPILKREPDLFPADTLEIEDASRPWWVAQTRSRHEKALARHLTQREVPFYLPKIEKRSFRSGRVFKSYVPLFTGYVFCRGDRNERLAALQSNVVTRILAVEDQLALHRELADLRRLQESGVVLIPHPYLGPGDRVEIGAGPFKGYRGKVLREKGKLRLVVSVSLLQRSVAAEFDRDALRPVGPLRGTPVPAPGR